MMPAGGSRRNREGNRDMTFALRNLRTGLRRVLSAAGLVICLSGLTGCNWLILAGYLIGGPPSIEPLFDAETGLSMTDKEVTVAVVCYAPKEVLWDFSEVDYDLAKSVAYQMFQRKIQVVNPDYIRDWLDRNPNWDTPAEIGAAFKTTYVVHIELSDYSLYEESSSELYRGRTEALVTVWEMDESKEDGEPIFSKDVTSVYPLGVPRSAYDTTYSAFKQEYLQRLSDEIGRLFYEYYNGDDIGAVN